MTHLQNWIGTLMENLDEMVDEETKIKVLENCGKSCIPESFVKKAVKLREKSENTGEFLKKLSKIWGHLKLEGDKVFVVYDKCYCPMVKSYKGELSKSFCHCSRGWVKELFESSLKKPVTVELEKSIRQGDDICRFRVRI